ncbi:MAG: DUF1963 domain-containing protein [Pseudomonadota bacterium]
MHERYGLLKRIGGWLLAIGIILVGIAGWKPGWGGLTRSLSEPALVLQIGIGLSLAGGLFLASSKILARRGRPSAVVKSVGARPELIRRDTLHSEERTTIPALGTQRRICLKPLWPQRDTSHWVGGLPSLPANTPWPQINGKPASFLAQIELDRLPDTLWQGLGPRSGWLVFFGDGETETAVKVLHVEGAVAPRDQPTGTNYHWGFGASVEGLRQMVGAEADVPPKWFIDVADQSTLGSVEDMESEDDLPVGQNRYWDGDNGNWIWEERRPLSWYSNSMKINMPSIRNGTTWDTPLAIFAAVRVALQESLLGLQRSIEEYHSLVQRTETELSDLTLLAAGSGEEAFQAQKSIEQREKVLSRRKALQPGFQAGLQIVERRLAELPELEKSLRDSVDQKVYDPTIGAKIHGYVESIDAELKPKVDVFRAKFDGAFASIMEHHARLIYSKDRSSVPQELYELYSPLWQQECEDTAIFLGTNSDLKAFSLDMRDSWQIRLLDLPSNLLTGVTIGDDSRLCAEIPPGNLSVGDFSTVYGTNTHGTR